MVRMDDGAVTFIGGTISSTKAVSGAVSAPIPCGGGDTLRASWFAATCCKVWCALRRRHATVRVVRLMLCVVLWFALWSVRNFFFALIAANQTPVSGTQTSHRRAWLSCGVCCACALLDWAKGGLCGGRAAVQSTRTKGYAGGGDALVRRLVDAAACST